MPDRRLTVPTAFRPAISVASLAAVVLAMAAATVPAPARADAVAECVQVQVQLPIIEHKSMKIHPQASVGAATDKEALITCLRGKLEVADGRMDDALAAATSAVPAPAQDSLAQSQQAFLTYLWHACAVRGAVAETAADGDVDAIACRIRMVDERAEDLEVLARR